MGRGRFKRTVSMVAVSAMMLTAMPLTAMAAESNDVTWLIPPNEKYYQVELLGQERIAVWDKYSVIGLNEAEIADYSGKVLTNEKFSEINPFYDGIAEVFGPVTTSQGDFGATRYDNPTGFVNVEGQWITPREYHVGSGQELGKPLGKFITMYDGDSHYDVGREYFVYDKTGKLVSSTGKEYSGIDGFSDDGVAVAWRASDGSYGLLDISGNFTSLPYDGIGEFHKGLASVRTFAEQASEATGYTREGMKSKNGFINTAGKLVVPLVYDEIPNSGFRFDNSNFAVVKKDGKFGAINTLGKEIIPCEYDVTWLIPPNDFTIQLKKDGQYYHFDKLTGEPVSESKIYNVEGIPFNRSGDYVGTIQVLKDSILRPSDVRDGVILVKTKYGRSYDKNHVQDKCDAGLMINPTLSNSERAKFAKYETTKTVNPMSSTTTTAKPTASKVLVDGKDISFDAYEISNNNYFKLRDVAKVLSGTGKQFEVTYDNSKKAINLVSNKAYTVTGGEMAKGDGSTKNAVPNTSKIYLDGKEVSLTAYTINGNNYFKLRDLGQTFNFGVAWDGKANTITIDTSKAFTAE